MPAVDGPAFARLISPCMTERAITYRNPVYPEPFADPAVLKVGSTYYAYGTAPPDGRGHHFPILRSPNLVHWEYVRHALLPATSFAHWAPEVAERDGRFYLYYSASDVPTDDGHRLRVAISDSPEGPFRDSGHLLLPQAGFSIDASPFRDPRSGRWFLFFATDYTEDEPYGTGLAVLPLEDDLLHADGEPHRVLRAGSAWQVYERNRNYKDRIWSAWNTLEGPFTIYHAGRYWCLYSGGPWHSENYGMGFAVADDPLGPWSDELDKDGPAVLRTTPHAAGPGHASLTVAPDGKTLMLVYHAWDGNRTARRMCIDPLTWNDAGPVCDGPSATERPLPT